MKAKTKQKPARPNRAIARLEAKVTDTWANGLTALGTNKDRSSHSYFRDVGRIDWRELEALYQQDAIAARICDRLADDATRCDYSLSGDEGVDWTGIREQLASLHVLTKIGDSIRWSRCYGGALLVWELVDGLNPRQRLRPKAISAISGIEVIEAPFVIPANPTGSIRSYTDPQVYEIVDTQVRVHKSRTVRFEGTRMPLRSVMAARMNGWPPGVLERVYTSLRRVGTVRGYAETLMHTLSLQAFKIRDLRKIQLGNKTEGPAQIREIFQGIQDSIDILHGVALDAGDEFSVVDRDVRGVVELLQVFDRSLVSDTDMPKEILLSETEAGLNSGEHAGPMRAWYDHVGKKREELVMPSMTMTVRLLLAAQGKPNAGFELVFDPLWQQDPKEAAETRLTNAQADAAYYQIGSVDAAEIRTERFVNGNTGDISIDPAANTAPAPVAISTEPIEGEPAVAPAAAGGAETVAEQAMTGIQIKSLQELVEAVAGGRMPRASAVEIVRVGFPTAAARAEFIIPPQGAPPPTAAPAVAPVDEEGEGELAAPESTDPPPTDPVSPREAAQTWGLPTRTISRLMETGALRYWGFGKRRVVSLAEVAKAGRSHETPPDQTPQDRSGATGTGGATT